MIYFSRFHDVTDRIARPWAWDRRLNRSPIGKCLDRIADTGTEP
jgi:hypothetical protein